MKCLELEEVLKSVVKIQESHTLSFLNFFGLDLGSNWHIKQQLVVISLSRYSMTQRKADSRNDPIN